MGILGLVGVGGDDDLLARKNYAMPECMSVEIGMQTHSNCVRNKNAHLYSYISLKFAYSVTSINSLNLVKPETY